MVGTGLQDGSGSSGAHSSMGITTMQQTASHTRVGPGNSGAWKGSVSTVHLSEERMRKVTREELGAASRGGR